MKILSNLFLLFFCFTAIFAQDTSFVVVNNNFKFNDGIFISFDQVKVNSPIPLSNVITPIDKNSSDFFEQLFKNDIVVFFDKDGTQKQIQSNQIWGYAKKGKLFVLMNSKPSMIPILGTISHFIATKVEYEYYNNYDQFNYYYYEPSKRIENIQYILYFPTGQILEFNINNIDPIFSVDKELYLQWSDLSKRKKKKLIFVYLRKFNEKHILMLPNNN